MEVGTRSLLQAFSAPDPSVIWLSGHDGSWARSLDGGRSWTGGQVPGHERLQFRDVHGFDAETALLMSAGTGADSRIFRTDDGGGSWTQVFVVSDPAGFLDCMDFWDEDRGLAYGDAVERGTYLLATDDGGRSWRRVPADGLPEPLEEEGGFAASGSCIDTEPPDRAWIATGNGPESRLFATSDGGATWTVTTLPLAGGASRGATTVGFRPDGLGFALGGDLDPDGSGRRVALSADRGVTWSSMGDLQMPGPVYGAAWVPDREPATLFAVGPGGMDWSTDGGMHWMSADTAAYWAVGFSGPTRGWALGPAGRVTRIDLVP
ncbi:MAG: hypothetical protein P8188_00890 [Gemmatimonadota bacterium]